MDPDHEGDGDRSSTAGRPEAPDEGVGPGDRRRDLEAALVDEVRLLSYRSQRLAGTFAAQQRMHPTDLEALVHVMHAENAGRPLTAGGLGAALGLSGAATTGVVDRLERSGHVRRHRDDRDRRRVALRTTEEALTVARAFFGPLGRRTGEALAHFDPDEVAVARRLLAAVSGAIAEAEAAHRTPRDGRPPR